MAMRKNCGSTLSSQAPHTVGILQYISIQFEILTNQEAPITGIHFNMPTVSRPNHLTVFAQGSKFNWH